MLAIVAALAIVVQDHTSLRAAPRSDATVLTTLWQGDVLEVREERADYLKVYDYRHERSGYVRSDRARPVGTTVADAAPLLAILRFLRDSRGSEALGISYGAAYIRAAPAQMLTAEAFAAIGSMAERLADQASSGAAHSAELAAHLEVVEQLGIHMRSFERLGRMQVCYDGELFRRVLTLSSATTEERAQAALAITRSDCIDPALGVALRVTLDEARSAVLDSLGEGGLSPLTLSRVRARRATVWAALAYERARHNESPAQAAQRALAELLAVRPGDLGADRQAEYIDAVVRVGSIRWAAALPAPQSGRIVLTASGGAPGQTCVVLQETQGAHAGPHARRCTYGIVWMGSVQSIAEGRMLVVAVQPLESWRELWVFREREDGWGIDVLSPGSDEPEEGYVEFAGYAPRTRRLLIAREVKTPAGFRRRFEELRTADLALVKAASSPELLSDFGHWQDTIWRRDTLSLH
jgi:Bacterial SH3 domain